MEKSRQNGLDWIKGLSCIAVVLIHYNFSNGFGTVIKTVCRFAVPIFFLVSGYFMLSGEELVCVRNKTIKKIKHISLLLIKAGFFYLLFNILWNKMMTPDWDIVAYITEKINRISVIKFILTNDPFVYAHLWFMLALIYCYILMLFFDHKYPEKIVNCFPILLIAFLIVSIWKDTFHLKSSIGGQIYMTSFFGFRALPFFLAGVWVRKHQEMFMNKKVKIFTLETLIMFGMAWSVLERMIFVESQFYLGTYIVVAALFLYALMYNEQIQPDSFLTHLGRDLSLYVYIFHIAVGKTLDLITAKCHLDKEILQYSRAFIVLCVSIMVAQCIYEMKLMSLKSCHK